jgi:hypothetical protein
MGHARELRHLGRLRAARRRGLAGRVRSSGHDTLVLHSHRPMHHPRPAARAPRVHHGPACGPHYRGEWIWATRVRSGPGAIRGSCIASGNTREVDLLVRSRRASSIPCRFGLLRTHQGKGPGITPAHGMRRAARTTESPSTEHRWSSEHRVVVGARLWERLENVPVFDDLAVLKPEKVGGHCAGVLGRGLDQPVDNDDVALADHTLDLDA